MESKKIQEKAFSKKELAEFQSPSKMVFDRLVGVMILLICLPVCCFNGLIAVILGKPILIRQPTNDCLGRDVEIYYFSSGIMRSTGVFLSLINGNIRLCGMPITLSLTELEKKRLLQNRQIKAGLMNAVDIHLASGLKTVYPSKLLQQQSQLHFFSYVLLAIRGGLSWLLFNANNKQLQAPGSFHLFGLKITNNTMSEAVDWVLEPTHQSYQPQCKIGFFINVNSVNLSFANARFSGQLSLSDRNFADGLGMRLAAKKAGIHLKANVNGTDLLPVLCNEAVKKHCSIYLLGSKPGVAQQAASNLCQQYPGLNVAGTEHGYFDKEDNQAVVNRINTSGADILLVALGSPIQEQWLLQNKAALSCHTALAVGGLLDFNAGKIARAPLWLRELGMEWVWRLWQEPKTKFKRYVIGNPMFMIRTYLLNQASRGH